MKKIKSTVLFALLFAAFSFTSCTKDDTASENFGTSTGNYYPMAVDNQWTMKQDTTAPAVTKIIGTDVFGGTTYYKLSGADTAVMGFDLSSWIAKKGATYLNKVGDLNYSQNGITIKMKGFEVPILKDNLAVGESWTSTAPMDMTLSAQGENETLKMTTKYTCTILEKNVAATVNGVSYSDVIKVGVKEELTMQDPTTGESQTTVVNAENWYANGVGPIKTITSSGDTSAETYLVDYIVKK